MSVAASWRTAPPPTATRPRTVARTARCTAISGASSGSSSAVPPAELPARRRCCRRDEVKLELLGELACVALLAVSMRGAPAFNAAGESDRPTATHRETLLFCSRAPVLIACIVMACAVSPIYSQDPTIGPYLNSPPFGLSEGPIGTAIATSAVGDVLGTVVAGPLCNLLGQQPVAISRLVRV